MNIESETMYEYNTVIRNFTKEDWLIIDEAKVIVKRQYGYSAEWFNENLYDHLHDGSSYDASSDEGIYEAALYIADNFAGEEGFEYTREFTMHLAKIERRNQRIDEILND